MSDITEAQRTFLPIASTYATVRMIAQCLGGRVTAQQVRDAIPEVFKDQFTIAVIRAEFGSLHDYGHGTVVGDSFRFDAA